MTRIHRFGLDPNFLAVLIPLFVVGSITAEDTRFNRDIRPILAKHCFACHGLDEETRQADLRLDDRSAAIAAGAIAPGNPAQSELLARVESEDPEWVMPPPDSGQKLRPEEIQQLRQWIERDAPYEKHWSFTPPVQVAAPPSPEQESVHPIDRFVLERLQTAGLRPNPQANRLVLLRRLALDLTGLPPSIEEADAFLADPSLGAYEAAVDRLLSSAAYGEHWARLWLDLARYADTKGYEKDRPRTIWRYRDWVIDALNQDMPYDQFTIEQLAGDLLPDATNEQILATAFHRNTMENEEGGTDDEEFRVAAVKDRVDTTLQVWMGLTFGCAKCHSHKYDPISQRDYYQLYALFNQTADADREPPTLRTPTPHQRQRLEAVEQEIRALQQQLDPRPSGYTEAWNQWRSQFETTPLWSPLTLVEFTSQHNVELNQEQDGTLQVAGELPEKDRWSLVVELPVDRAVTALRLDTTPKSPGGKWKDKNVALREMTVELLQPDREPVPLKLVQPRADFSQRGWDVARAIDGDPSVGWAFSPKAAEPHCAVFNFEKPIEPGAGRSLRLTLDQQYGQGLLLDTFRLSVSSYPTSWLAAELDPLAKLETVFQRHVYAATKGVHAQIAEKQQMRQAIQAEVPATPIIRELPTARQRETRIHQRGNFLDPGEIVTGNVPEVFGALGEDLPRNRLGVAHWLMQADNPLTARVAVNRVWAQLFGTGLVETEEDFGTQGTLPSHPELLDWLAVDFRERGWSLKHLIKTIVLSRTYQQSSVTTSQHLRMDPRNRLLSRGPRFRLSAEAVRDQALAASGLLTRQIGGPSVMPPQPGGIWKSTYSGDKWQNAVGANRYRRALYTFKKRTSPYPAMLTFDSGSGEICLVRRVRTNTPLQALVTLNDTAFIEAAGALALRMDEAAETTRDKIAQGFRRILIRHPEPAELDRLVALYDSLEGDLATGAPLLKAAGLSAGDPRLVAVANVLLNLDETLTKP